MFSALASERRSAGCWPEARSLGGFATPARPQVVANPRPAQCGWQEEAVAFVAATFAIECNEEGLRGTATNGWMREAAHRA